MGNNRGFAQVIVIVAIAVVGILVAVPAYKAVKSFGSLFGGDSKAKTQVTQLVGTQAQEAAAQATKDKAAQDAAVNLAATQAAKDKRIAQGAQLVVGVGQALNKEQTPSVNVQVAKTLNSEALKAFDPVDQPQIDAMQAIVDQATSGRAQDAAAFQAKIDQITGQLTTERQTETTLRNQQAGLNAQVVTDQATVNTLQSQVTKDGANLKQWASDNKSLLAKIAQLTMWLTILGVVLFVVHWLFPLIAKAFPGVPLLASIAKVLGGVLAAPLAALHSAEKDLITKAKTEVESLLATTKTQLASEVAAHQATQATLIAVATAPTPVPATVVTTSSVTTPSAATT